MTKKLILASMVMLTIASTLAAQSGSALFLAKGVAGAGGEERVKFVEKVRSEIARLGTGPEARIEVRLEDKTKLQGFIRESDETQFVVVDSKTGVATPVLYPQVRKVRGNNLSYGAKVAIGFGIAILALVIFCTVHGCEE
jgi:hypothetical protein